MLSRRLALLRHRAPDVRTCSAALRQSALDPADVGIGAQEIPAVLAAGAPGLGERHLDQRQIARPLADVAQDLARQRLAIGRLDRREAKRLGDDPAQAVIAHPPQQKAGAAVIGVEACLQPLVGVAQIGVVVAHGQHDFVPALRRITEVKKQIDEGRTKVRRRYRQQLLELIYDQEHLHPLGREIAAQSAADLVDLAARRPIGEGAAIGQRQPETFGGVVDRIAELAEGLVARPGGHDVPDGVLRSGAVEQRERAAAEARHQAGAHQGRFARAAVAGDQHERRPVHQRDQRLGFLAAAEEQMAAAFVDRAQTEEGLGLELQLPGLGAAQDCPHEKVELVGLGLDVEYTLELLREAGQGFRAGRGASEDRDEAVVGLGDRAVQGEAHLGLDPVHHALAADVDRERVGSADRLLEL